MFGKLNRLRQVKADYKITVKILKIAASVEDDCEVQVVWKRGPEEQKGEWVDLNYIEVDADLQDEFSKVSGFYKASASAETYEEKKCQFVLNMRNSYGEQAFGNIEMNMAAYVGKDSEPQKIEFPDSFFKDTYINVEWTIQLDESARSSTITASTSNVATKTFTQAEVDDMIKSAETLETQKVELAAQLEKIYEEQAVIKEAMAKEHKNHKYMQGKLDIIEANVEKFKVQEKYLKSLIEITNENQEKAEAET